MNKITLNTKNEYNTNQLKKVFVALSGGVDSAVTAYLLTQKGYQVTGIYMKNWSGENLGIQDECPWKKDQKDAHNVCKHLKIPFKTYNFEKAYRKSVIQYFFDEYKAGRTPNPDILCNQKIKFGLFLQKALSEGADLIATGHYARKGTSPKDQSNNDVNDNLMKNKDKKIKKETKYTLLRAKDPNKDQTYFLYRINPNQLSKTLFPLGNLTKKEVRKIAKEKKLPVANKKDSQGICFIGKIDVQDFLQTQIKPQKGDIIDIDTHKKVGEHNGVWFYTLGQRKGLEIGGAPKPYFVAKKDVSDNILYVAMGKNHPSLYKKTFHIKDVHWINNPPSKPKNPSPTNNTSPQTFSDPLKGMVRYRQTPQRCSYNHNKVTFHKPIWQAAPGQSLILIKNNVVLGGGVISK